MTEMQLYSPIIVPDHCYDLWITAEFVLFLFSTDPCLRRKSSALFRLEIAATLAPTGDVRFELWLMGVSHPTIFVA